MKPRLYRLVWNGPAGIEATAAVTRPAAFGMFDALVAAWDGRTRLRIMADGEYRRLFGGAR